ncbi:MAG: hypothetical protein E7633_04315 [Ruminococcaceae bacterium]|nr:hypothetical protein [Oscillospiraceae bacterium]
MLIISLNQMAVLALFILIGFAVAKLKVVNSDASSVLSKLENNIFIPALVMGTFITNFTVEKLGSAWKILLFSFVIELLVIPIAILSSKLATKNGYIRKIYTYGLAFSNFGFMGIPIVSALFPEYEMYYIIFTLPLWTLIYVWGVPNLLIDTGDKKGILARLKALANPMFISLIIGALIGISGVKLPGFVTSVVNTCGNCMSPLAMIITGITFANINIRKVLSDISIYFVSFMRLIVVPCVFAGVFLLLQKLFAFELEEYYFVCMLCSLAMPLGLNTVVVPAAYGKDTSVAAGMALISHVLSVITIPIILTIFGV